VPARSFQNDLLRGAGLVTDPRAALPAALYGDHQLASGIDPQSAATSEEVTPLQHCLAVISLKTVQATSNRMKMATHRLLKELLCNAHPPLGRRGSKPKSIRLSQTCLEQQWTLLQKARRRLLQA